MLKNKKMKNTCRFFTVVMLLVCSFLFVSRASAKFVNEESYPFVPILEPGIRLEAGNDADNAPWIEPGIVYEGNISTEDDPRVFKVHLKRGQKVSVVLNVKKETALDSDDECAAMDFCLNGECSSFPIGGGPLFAPAPILPRDTSFHSFKIPDNILNAYEEKYVTEDRDYIVSVSTSWFNNCGNYSKEDIKNAPEYTSRRIKLEEEKQKNNRAFYKVKVIVTGSAKEYAEYLKKKEEDDALYQIEADKSYQAEIANDPVRKKLYEDNRAMQERAQKDYEKSVDWTDESDYPDEEDSGDGWLKNILVSIASLVFIGGAVTAGVLFWRKKKMGNGEVVASNLDFSQSSSDIPNAQLCSICGDPITLEMDFCGKCGSKLK